MGIGILFIILGGVSIGGQSKSELKNKLKSSARKTTIKKLNFNEIKTKEINYNSLERSFFS